MAAATPQQTPIETDLFRFVSVRGVNSPEPGATERRFVFSGLPDTYAALDTQYPGPPLLARPLLLVELPQLAPNPQRAALMRRAVELFTQQSPHRLLPAAFDQAYPINLRLVDLWHRDQNRDRQVTRQTFVSEVEAAMGQTVGSFVTRPAFVSDKVRLWENLIAEYILASSSRAEYLARLTDMARWFWILEKLNSRGLNDGQEIYEAMHATVVLPNDVFHLEPPSDPGKEPRTREHDADSERDANAQRLKDLDAARAALNAALRTLATDARHTIRAREVAKGPTPREKPASAGEPATLNAKGVAALDPSTQGTLRSLNLIDGQGGVDVTHALDRLNVTRSALADRTSQRPAPVPMADINGQFVRLDNLCHDYTPPDPCKPYGGEPLPKRCGLIREPGFADLKVIRSVLLKYERGELAHIENVLDGETKVRQFNTMKRTEETLVTEEETTSETEKETQTTDRFELEKEISSQTKEDMKLDTGVKVTATLGPVSIDTHFDFQYNTSKEESTRVATKNAQETINRALSRVTERRKTQRTQTTIIQTDDNNKHRLQNKSGNNIHGLYYWLDKYYLSKVINYGKRLMFEFVVPEPAAFFLFASKQKAEGEKVPPVPLYLLKIFSLNEITDDNYAGLAAFYGAPDIVPPPPEYVIISTSVEHDKTPIGKDQEDVDKEDIEFTLIDTNEKLKVPAGYIAHHADIAFVIAESSEQKRTGQQCDHFLGIEYNCHDVYTDVQNFHILIGNQHLRPHSDWSPMHNIALNTEDAVIPLAVNGKGRHCVVTVEVVCYRTDKRYREWKNATFNALVTAYNQQVTAYEDWQRSREIGTGVVIEGNNEAINRRTEKEELKKHCIEMMTGQRFESFDAMRSNVPSLGYPEFSIVEALSEGNYLQFFEQAFEWEQITYIFYPYYWGRKPGWIGIKKITDPDPIFTSFLRAGAARVLVPARPGFEYDVVTYFASGGQKVWGGKQAPIPGSEHWLPIIDELKEQEGQFTGGSQEGDPWIYKLPTTLVYLDNVNAALLDNSPNYPNDVAAATKPKAGDFS